MSRSSRTEEPWALHRLLVQHCSLACSIVRKGLPNGRQHPWPRRRLNCAISRTTQPTRSELLWLSEKRGSSRWCHQSWQNLGLMKVIFLVIRNSCSLRFRRKREKVLDPAAGFYSIICCLLYKHHSLLRILLIVPSWSINPSFIFLHFVPHVPFHTKYPSQTAVAVSL